MPAGRRTEVDADDEQSPSPPDIAACESRPGTVVLIESGNPDGWIASDLASEPID